jgi:hypothetical protein
MRKWKVAYAFALALGGRDAATPIASTAPRARFALAAASLSAPSTPAS